MTDLEKAKLELLNFKNQKPNLGKTIFGEIVIADPKTCADNSKQLASLCWNYWKELLASEGKKSPSEPLDPPGNN